MIASLVLACTWSDPDAGRWAGAADSGPTALDSGAADDGGMGGEMGEEIACADPDARTTEGPLQRLDLSALVASYTDDLGQVPPAAGTGVAVADMDGDGLLDLLLPQLGPDQVLRQTDDGGFVDATAELWPDAPDAPSIAINTVDLDADGDEDVFVCHEIVPNALYLNDGTGRLTDVSAAWGVDAQRRGCFNAAFGDIDGDEDLDLVLANNDPCDSTPDGDDCSAIEALPSAQVLWENTGDRFVDITDRLSQDEMRASMMSVITLVDLDDDHDLDIFVTNDDRMEVPFSTHNVAYENDGAGGFTDISDATGLAISMEGMGAGVGDLNDDGVVDLLVTGFRDVALLLSGDGGWYDADVSTGMVPTEESRWFAWGAELADLDADGDLDAPVVFGWLPPDEQTENPLAQRDALYLQQDGRFEEVAEAWGWADDGIARGLAVVDLDGDGWLDLLKRELGGPLRVDRARCGANGWLTVRLVQDGANRDAVGALVLAEVDGTVHRRWILRGGTSYGSSVPPRIHFGLGDADRIDALSVIWPDGDRDDFGPQRGRRHLTLSRP